MKKSIGVLLLSTALATIACGLGGKEEPTPTLLPSPVPAEEEAPTAEPVVEQAPAPEGPTGVNWRLGGVSGVFDDEFAALGGVDIAPDGTIYVADNTHGIYVFDSAGNQIGLFGGDVTNNAHDVEVGPDGNIYVAAWGNNSVFVFTPDGTQLAQWGSEGNGDGQFGTFSPEALAVGPDNNVYVLDLYENDVEEDLVRVQVFSSDGTFLSSFPVVDDFFSPTDIEFGPDGNIYILGFLGSSIQVFDTAGNFIKNMAEESLDFAGAQQFDFDDAGNIYVTTWTPAGVMKLDPSGNFVNQYGFEVENGDAEWPEGGFYQSSGVAVSGDGSQIVATDWSGEYAYITALDPSVTTTAPPADTSTDSGDADTSEPAPAIAGDVQWATFAVASSQYGDTDWSASQATGAPDSPNACGDHVTAWASASASGVETLTLNYATPVVPSQIQIVQTYNPGAVIRVDVVDVDGNATTVYEGTSSPLSECPYTYMIDVTGVTGLVNTINITLDEGPIANWSEVDAVGLVGTP